MTQKQILEGNKIIAEFMGERYEPFNGSIALSHEEEGVWYYNPVVYLDYNSDWSLLMPVVEKIEKLGFQFFIHNEGAYIRKWFYKGNFPDLGNVGKRKIYGTFQTVIDFIKWYNQNK